MRAVRAAAEERTALARREAVLVPSRPSWALALPCLGLSLAAQERELDPSAPCTARRSNEVTYQVDLRAVITAPYGTERLQVWMPVPPSDDTQTVADTRFETWPTALEPRITSEPVYGNRFAYFEFEEPRGAQMIRHTCRVTTRELRWNVDPGMLADVREWPDSFAPYLHGESQAVVLDDEVRAQARAVVPAPVNAALDMQRLMSWIEANMTYDHSAASLRASSEWALEKRAGHCSDYHGLCSALGRALGHPTRVVYGLNTLPKNSPSHCKSEVFLPPYGWVSFDLSETQKLIRMIESAAGLGEDEKRALGDAARRRLFSGFRDNTWFVQTRGSDYELVPPASRRVPIVRTLYAEADGEPLPEPDPGDARKREFAWMTLHEYRPDRPVSYPFTLEALAAELAPEESR